MSMGGAAAMLTKSRAAYDAGEYRFVADVLTHLVFAEPENADARQLQADAFEQLGYQSESAPWRNCYLTGAQELRDITFSTERRAIRAPSPLSELVPVARIFDALSVSLDGSRADRLSVRIDWHFTDGGGRFFMLVERSVLHYWKDREDAADVRVDLTREALVGLLSGRQQFSEIAASGTSTSQAISRTRAAASTVRAAGREHSDRDAVADR